IGITDGLNYGNPTNEEVFWQMEKSLEGVTAACESLAVPVTSGNVSMYNQSYGEPIYPTPIIGTVGLYKSMNDVNPYAFQTASDAIYVICGAENDFRGYELQVMSDGKSSGKAPQFDLQVENNRQAQQLDAIKTGIIQSADDISEGGLAL